MIPRLVGTEGGDIAIHSLGREFAIAALDGEHLMSRSLDSSRLVQSHVARSGGDNALVGAQKALDDRGVGLRATHQQMHLAILQAARRENLPACRSTILIYTVAYRLLQIGAHECLQNQRVRALHVIAIKVLHRTKSIKICANLSSRYSFAISANDA